MSNAEKLIRIGDYAKIFDINIKTVRYYESIGLIIPAYVDIYSGYRYFNEENVKRMNEIIALKELGFSLDEIKYFKESEIKNKIIDYENKILKIKEQIRDLKELSMKGKEVLKMKKFMNDERVIGKWNLLGVSANMEDAKKSIYIEDDYAIKELYLMPEGQEYWVISWTKDIIYLAGKACPYEINDNKMYVKIQDDLDENMYKVSVYEKVDSKIYTEEEIKVKDDINVDFVSDSDLVGFWHTVDFVANPQSFNPNKIQFESSNLPLQKVSFSPNGEVYINYKNNDNIKSAKYTKGYIINFCLPDTLSKYTYQDIDGIKYLVIEWKSGDYVYGRMINGYYVLVKE